MTLTRQTTDGTARSSDRHAFAATGNRFSATRILNQEEFLLTT